MYNWKNSDARRFLNSALGLDTLIQSGNFGKLDFHRVQDRIRKLTAVTDINNISIVNYSIALATKFDHGGEQELNLVCETAADTSVVQLAAFQTRAVLRLQRSHWAAAKRDFERILRLPNISEDDLTMTPFFRTTHFCTTNLGIW